MDYRNADGSLAEMCGNGIRVFARYLVDEGLHPAGDLAVPTRDGVKAVRLAATGDVTVDMGPATLPGTDRKVVVGDRTWPAVEVTTGNPHAVVFVDGLADAGELRTPPVVEPAVPGRRQRRVRRTPGGPPRGHAGARARGRRDPVLRHRGLRGDGGQRPGRRRGARLDVPRWTSPAAGCRSPSARTATSS